MHKLDDLLALMERLRDPASGCPWDREQNFASISPYTIEEAYEVADAIDRNNMQDLCCELGDLLFQIVFQAQLAKEQATFAFDDIVHAITEKMRRRHPHVFANVAAGSTAEQAQRWESFKETERLNAQSSSVEVSDRARPSVMEGVLAAQPALNKAKKLQIKAASVGFDWPDAEGIFAKLVEESQEFKQALAAGDKKNMTEEIGDLIFTVVNLARFHHIDPDAALRISNSKFERRFRAMEQDLQEQGKSIGQVELSEMQQSWLAQKKL